MNEIEGPKKFDNLRVANDSWCKAPLCDYVVISNWIMPVECILPGLNAGTQRIQRQIGRMRNSSKSKNGAKSSIAPERSSKLRSVAQQPFSPRSVEKASRIRDAVTVTSVCPYCAVGCSQLVHVKGGRIINIEGNPESPINEGTLCPKGANTSQLTVNPHRITKVLYRAPYSDQASLGYSTEISPSL